MELVNGALGDGVRARAQGVLYCQNATQFHGTRGNIMPSPVPVFHESHKWPAVLRGHHVERNVPKLCNGCWKCGRNVFTKLNEARLNVCGTEFYPNLITAVKMRAKFHLRRSVKRMSFTDPICTKLDARSTRLCKVRPYRIS
jgi:hypothetical protein